MEIEIKRLVHFKAYFHIAMALCSRLIWIANSSEGNYFVCKRFAIQTLLWSLEFVIQINLEHDTIAI